MPQSHDRRRRQVALSAAISAALLAACGGGGGDAPKPPEPIRAAPPGSASAGDGARATVAPPAEPIKVAIDGMQSRDWSPSGPDDDPTVVKIGGLHSRKPASWTWQPPSMQFRRLQYSVPGRDGAGAAELVFSIFVGTEGGPTELNVERWNRQFRDEDGQPSEPLRREDLATVNPTLLVEHQGAYLEMGAAAPRAQHRQLAAVIHATGRRVFVRLVGPDATVEANRAAFLEMVSLFREDTVPLPGSPQG